MHYCRRRHHRWRPPRGLGLLRLLLTLGNRIGRPSKACLGCRDWTVLGTRMAPHPAPLNHVPSSWTNLIHLGPLKLAGRAKPWDVMRPHRISCCSLIEGGQAAAASPGQCNTIYQGFAECLIRLGDGMGHGGELETICRSWNDFHTCASRVLSGCPEEAAAVWESLQQEARRARHPDNLHALCDTPVRIQESGTGPETNQETLRATAPVHTAAPELPLLVTALALACLLRPLIG